jgi:hypothetical protein
MQRHQARAQHDHMSVCFACDELPKLNSVRTPHPARKRLRLLRGLLPRLRLSRGGVRACYTLKRG